MKLKTHFSLVIAPALIVLSGTTAIYLAGQPELTNAQAQVFETSIKIYYGASTTLLGVLTTSYRLQNKKQLPKRMPRKKDKSDDNTDSTNKTDQ